MKFAKFAFLGMAAITFAALQGCNKSPDQNAPATQAATETHSHESWWCDEHGVPESECALCHPKVAADFKAKGDWCAKHDRPDSQCFVCHPENEAKFAERYAAKYGKQPPKPTVE
jgi:cobalt-zinc-cadmium efflux system membrane fusion protein